MHLYMLNIFKTAGEIPVWISFFFLYDHILNNAHKLYGEFISLFSEKL